MKPFTEFLMETRPKYEFVIRIANCDLAETKSKLESSLAMYVVESIGTPRRLPIQEHADFPHQGPCEVAIVEVTLKYPTITNQIRQIVAEKLNIPSQTVVVRTKNEEAMREPQPAPKKDKNGSVLTNPDLETENHQALVGNKRVDSTLKELQSIKLDFAARGEVPKEINMPQGVKSPIGSTQNKITSPKGR